MDDTQLPDVGEDPASRPTHRLEDIKVGDYGVQLLVSTKDHLYDAKGVEAGPHSWQVIGAWEESSVEELAKILNQRQASLNRESTGTAHFGTAYGTGQKLGADASGNRRQMVVRQEST